MNCFVTATLLVLSSTTSAQTLYVDAGLTTGADDGSSWANAYRGQVALTVALLDSVAGQDIFVAEGVYRPSVGTRAVSFPLKTGVGIYGGFAGGESSLALRPAFGANPSVLSGDLAGNDTPLGNRIDNSYHVIYAVDTDASAILDGFEIYGGNANGNFNLDVGAGIFVLGSGSPTIQNCLFRDNRSRFGGGAAYLSGSSPKFFRCSFEDNLAGSSGGAVNIVSGGAIVFDGCTFRGNHALRGGALEIFTTGEVRVLNSLFVGNVATAGRGGGLWLGSSGQSIVSNCTIVGNSAPASVGGGIRVVGSSSILRNLILWDNEGASGTHAFANQVSGASDLRNSIIEGNLSSANGNLGLDPLFVDAAMGDYSIANMSPAIDAGDNAGVPLGFIGDYLQKRRFVDDPMTPDTGLGTAPIVDMGAFEFSAGVLGTTYCDSAFNASGRQGLIDAVGSLDVAANNFTLVASGLTVNRFGIFLASRERGFIAFPGGSSGNLCLGGAIGRIQGLGQVVNSGPNGSYSVMLDLTAIATPTGFVAVQAGESWSFQSWYRDLTIVGATSNYTDGTTVTFE